MKRDLRQVKWDMRCLKWKWPAMKRAGEGTKPATIAAASPVCF
ncbi:hypothetical protein [Pontibacter fetidus]|nr:hypothetical protein [Pontibacter fetidus]